MIKLTWVDYLKISIILSIIILLLMGFLIGYYYHFYKNEDCMRRPLSYGIEKLNEVNKDQITCYCYPFNIEKGSFYFNESGLFE